MQLFNQRQKKYQMKENHKIVIIGDGETAELAYEYFTYDSPHEVVGFAVETEYKKRDEFFGLPVVAFEEIEKHFNPHDYQAFAAISYTQLNRVRTRIFRAVKEKGYTCASYVSSRAFVWHNVEIGENCFIFENNVIQYKVKIGDNVVLWSGNHIGHDSVIEDHVFVSSHVVISGHVRVGAYSFLGVNATIRNGIAIAPHSLIGAGAVVMADTEEHGAYVQRPAQRLDKKSDQIKL